MTRTPSKLETRPWRDEVDVVQGDIEDPISLKEAAVGCDVAFYLVHSMEQGRDFERRDRDGAINFASAAEEAGLRRIVYLGGLSPGGRKLSAHLRSRQEVGRLLAGGATPVTELQAAVIIGSGSLSFEMLRYLTEVLPVMTTPRWVRTRCQPVAIGDVLDALVEAAHDRGASRVVEIGGPEVLTYQQMMQVYAQEAGLSRRVIIPVPMLTPRISSLWVGLVTPLPARTARSLISSLRSEVVVRSDDRIEAATSYREAVRRALAKSPSDVETRWADAGSSPSRPYPGDPTWSGGTLFADIQHIPTEAHADLLYWAVARIGGDVGYYRFDWAWRVRGLLDQLVGGVGLRRGRRHPSEVRTGDAVDFWRVEAVEPGRLLRLRAEMKLPGEAWLQWEIVETGDGSDLRQIAWFQPRGLWGRLYWYAVAPAHALVFPRMACAIAATAEERGFSCR